MSNQPTFGRDAAAFLAERGFSEQKRTEKEFGIRITAICALGSEKKTVRVLVSNPSGREEVEFVLMNIHAEELGLDVGDIDESLLPELEYYSEVSKAYGSACSSFAFAPSSYSALAKKLLSKGFSKDVCSDAIECVKKSGFVKEEEIALRRAQIFVDKRWGRSRIFAKLREEGFNDNALSFVGEYLDEVDFASICAEHIMKKYGVVPADEHDRSLMYASLARMGYSSADVRAAIKILK